MPQNTRTRFLLLVIAVSISTITYAQWYFETGVNGFKFTDLANVEEGKTALHSYNGLRDMSNSVGYVFPFKSVETRSDIEAKPSVFRVAIGIGFDQMNLRSNATTGTTETPVFYNMSQVQGQLTLLFTPPLLTRKRPDELGVRRSAINLLLESGLSYGFYTNAVKTYTTNKGNITDLKEQDGFKASYPAFSFAGGLEFPITRQTTLYTKFVVENAFSTSEESILFSVVKHRAMVGIRADFRLANRLKQLQEKRIADLEASIKSNQERVDIKRLNDRVKSLEETLKTIETDKEIKTHKAYDVQTPVLDERFYEVENNDKGFLYIPEFKEVLFPINSSCFDHIKYEKQFKNMVSFVRVNPHVTVKLIGYSDSSTGTKELNQRLSEKRAKEVYNRLIALGISPERMLYEGAGGTYQFSSDDLSKNRRTEIIILTQ